MQPPSLILGFVRGFAGALLGAVVGFYIVRWGLAQGLYALAIPGALLGFGFGKLSGLNWIGYRLFCASAGIFVGVFIEWRFFPFAADDSFSYFLTNIHKLRPMTLIMIAFGALCAYWFADRLGNPRYIRHANDEPDL